MPQARLELLGGFQLASSAGQSIALSARKPRALLAYLALSSGRAHPRERLAGLLWSDSSDVQARSSLRQALTALRRSLAAADAVISADVEQVGLVPAALAVDAVEFERCVTLGTVESLQRALLLYRGDLLDGFSTEAPAFEQWLVSERERLRSLAIQGLAALLGFQRRNSLTDQAVKTAARLVALDPLREDAQRELMRLYVQQGRMMEALKQYQLLRRMLCWRGTFCQRCTLMARAGSKPTTTPAGRWRWPSAWARAGYENAIEACLADADFVRAERYANALREYTRREPLPWSEFFARRGVALVQAARGVRSAALRAELDSLVEEAEQAGLLVALPRLEAAQAALAD